MLEILLRLAGLFGYPYPRAAPASQAREPDSPSGLRPLPLPVASATRFQFMERHAPYATNNLPRRSELVQALSRQITYYPMNFVAVELNVKGILVRISKCGF